MYFALEHSALDTLREKSQATFKHLFKNVFYNIQEIRLFCMSMNIHAQMVLCCAETYVTHCGS